MAGLQAKEGHGLAGAHGRPLAWPLSPDSPLGTSTAITGLPAWLIASTSAASAPSSGRFSPAPNSASTIDVEIARCDRAGCLDGTSPLPGHRRGIALERGDIAGQRNGHAQGRARAGSVPRRTRLRHYCPDRTRRARSPAARVRRRHSVGDRPPCPLHQRQAGYPGGNRSLVGRRHFGGAQQCQLILGFFAHDCIIQRLRACAGKGITTRLICIIIESNGDYIG
jgi:hypothetical protein